MGWVTEKFSDGLPVDASVPIPKEKEKEKSFEATADNTWAQLTAGFESDVAEINRREGDADFKQLEAHQARISSGVTRIAVLVTADLDAHTIQYVYEPQDARVAVPEQGVLTMRPAASGIELYSADQCLTSDQARRMILEPLFFVNPPLQATGS